MVINNIECTFGKKEDSELILKSSFFRELDKKREHIKSNVSRETMGTTVEINEIEKKFNKTQI